MSSNQPAARLVRSLAIFLCGAAITLACTRVRVSWDQAASAAAPGNPAGAGVVGSAAAGTAAVPSLPPPSSAQLEAAKSVSRTFAQVADQMAPSVVSIRVAKKAKGGKIRHSFRGLPFPFGNPFGGNPFGGPDDDNGFDDEDGGGGPTQKGAGSGFVIDEKGYVLTNNHVVGGADDIKVKFSDGREVPAKVVGTDPRSDLAVIKVDGKGMSLRAARLGDSEKLLVGEWVLAIGNPFGLDHTVTVGVISAKGRRGITDTRGYEDFLQTDASINPGNSGGPLVNLSGEVIGINTAILGPGNIGIGFAVPSDLAKPVVRDLIAGGKVRRPFLGISMQEMGPELARQLGAPEKGALVHELVPDGPAQKAGVKVGDVITSVDGRAVQNSRDVQKQVLTHRIGDTVSLDVWRNGKSVKLSARAAELPGDEELAKGGGEQGKAKAKLGLQLQTLTPDLAERLGVKAQGVVIRAVKPGSPAAEANLTPGDVILEVDRQPVRTADDAAKALGTERQGGHVLLIKKGDHTFFVLLQP